MADEEAQELRSTPILIGGEEPGTGVLVVYPAMTQEEWEAEYGGMRRPVENTAPAPAAEVIDAEPLPPLNQGPPAGDEVVL